MDNQNSSQEHLWKRCPKGMLRQVADRSKEQKRVQKSPRGQNQFDRRHLLKIAAAVAVTTGAGTIAYRSMSAPTSMGPIGKPTAAPAMAMGYGGISCGTFISNLQKFIDEGLEDQELVAKMDKHLELCKGCKARYDRKQTA